MVDLQGCPLDILINHDAIHDFVEALPQKIGMTPIRPVNTMFYEGKVPEDCGITSDVIIAESHITVHTFSKKGWCFIDVFSCREFDIKKTVGLIEEFFGPKKTDHWIIQRGINFPRSNN